MVEVPSARSNLHGHPPLRTEARPLAQGDPLVLRREPSPRECRREPAAALRCLPKVADPMPSRLLTTQVLVGLVLVGLRLFAARA
jgi:hypothetical protein